MASKKSSKTAVLILESQPPTMGEYLLFLREIDNYDFMWICVDGNVSVMPLQMVYAVWKMVSTHYAKKIKIVSTRQRFDEVTELAEEFEGAEMLTTDRKIFAALGSLGIPVKLLPRVGGYHSVFYRAAYRKSLSLDWLYRFFPPACGSNLKD